LEAALAVWRRLRVTDSRFELEICGGDRLWGGTNESRPPNEPGLTYSGLLGQRALFERFQQAGFVIQLQEVQEGFGISVAEGMAAGCIVLASPVGAYEETIRHGFNGFLARSEDQAVEMIQSLIARPEIVERVRRNATAWPLDWDTVAATWVGHWEWLLSGKKQNGDWWRCEWCGGWALPLADGYHCTECGDYSQKIFLAK
jgi:glycosyltransferase involved in cell wall biosynthesis